MTPQEAAALLAMAAAFDNRKPDVDAAKAWALALDGLRFEDCREAVIEHFKDSSDWLMPKDVRARVRRIREKRLLAFGRLPEPPAEIDPDDTAALIRWESDTRKRIADGNLMPSDIQQLDARKVDYAGPDATDGRRMITNTTTHTAVTGARAAWAARREVEHG